jgi:2,3-bisphosphoglycerate-independent phosphoglycerate mutase
MFKLESKAMLVILDGFGIATDPKVSAVDQATLPYFTSLIKSMPNTQLSASGEDVGLPDGQFGNSEVGHLNIGAGRIVWQALSRINKDIRDGDFYTNPVLLESVKAAKKRGYLHVMGLFSDGGVHSHNNHLYAILALAKKEGLKEVFVHAFTDGRDTAPQAGLSYLEQFQEQSEQIGIGKIVSIVGRYFAMDRDNRWERVKKAYDLLTAGKGQVFEYAKEAFKASYHAKITDEFIEPVCIGNPLHARIQQGDAVLFYNIRGDRAREITRAFTQDAFTEFDTHVSNLHYTCFTSYDSTFEEVSVAYPPQNLANTLGEWVSKKGKTQYRIAETEKYPHVTYFFNGGIEEPNKGEVRKVIPSPRVATYDLQPEMSAPEVAQTLVSALKENIHDLVVLNFANPDMVGHTGNMQAAIKAVEAVDKELEKVVTTATEMGYKTLIIADHGNADQMEKEDGSPHTAHTTSLVPAILVGAGDVSLHQGKLADVAPTLLKMMGLAKPSEMTGKVLY